MRLLVHADFSVQSEDSKIMSLKRIDFLRSNLLNLAPKNVKRLTKSFNEFLFNNLHPPLIHLGQREGEEEQHNIKINGDSLKCFGNNCKNCDSDGAESYINKFQSRVSILNEWPQIFDEFFESLTLKCEKTS